MSRVRTYFSFTLGSWLAFYCYLCFINLNKEGCWQFSETCQDRLLRFGDLGANVLQNFATVFLLLLYAELVAMRGGRSRPFAPVNVYRTGWVIVFLSVTVYEFLEVVSAVHPFTDMVVYPLLYGLGQSIALFLVIGRLEDSFLRDHLLRMNGEVEQGKWKVKMYMVCIYLGYAYASLQPAYILFQEPRVTLFVLVVLALVLKISLGWLFIMMARRQGPFLSPLESYFYDQDCFAEEGLKNYERNFLRRYLNSSFARRHKQKQVGYLGVEYESLNSYKLEHLFKDDSAEHPQGGMYVREIQYGSDAARKGIRRGDIITHIDGAPYGGGNSLSGLLKGKESGTDVRVRFLRPTKHNGTTTLPIRIAVPFSRHQVTVKLGDIAKFNTEHLSGRLRGVLNQQYLGHDRQHGVWCKGKVKGEGEAERNIVAVHSPLWGFTIPVVDRSMLQWATTRLTPGETIRILCHGLNRISTPAEWKEVHTRARYQIDADSQSRIPVNWLNNVSFDERPQVADRNIILKGYSELFSQRLMKTTASKAEEQRRALALDAAFLRGRFGSVEQLYHALEEGEHFIALFDMDHTIVYQALVMRETISDYLRPFSKEDWRSANLDDQRDMRETLVARSLLLQEIPMSTLYLFICRKEDIQSETNDLGTQEKLCTKGIFTKLTMQVERGVPV